MLSKYRLLPGSDALELVLVDQGSVHDARAGRGSLRVPGRLAAGRRLGAAKVRLPTELDRVDLRVDVPENGTPPPEQCVLARGRGRNGMAVEPSARSTGWSVSLSNGLEENVVATDAFGARAPS